MLSAQETSLGVVAYLAIFCGVGLLFIFANLLLGRFLRPRNPRPEKLEIYECGEPAIGSSFVQFDLRFYVVALLFIIFDVEVAFFFPWAAVFGKTLHLADPRLEVVQATDGGQLELTQNSARLYRELGVRGQQLPSGIPASLGQGVSGTADAKQKATAIIKQSSRQLAWITVFDIGLFFAILLVGFAYVWRRGDLNWVRALPRDREAGADATPLSTQLASAP